jgi:hypothetical protein
MRALRSTQSLALGVLIVSLRGSNIDLIHVLFGTILAVDDADLILVASISSLTLFTLALIYRGLIVECFDPGYLKSVGGWGAAMHFILLVLVVLNLVAGFRALGTLMAVGLMMLPAASSRFWASRPDHGDGGGAHRDVVRLCRAAPSFHVNLPSAFHHPHRGFCYIFSVIWGHGGLVATARASIWRLSKDLSRKIMPFIKQDFQGLSGSLPRKQRATEAMADNHVRVIASSAFGRHGKMAATVSHHPGGPQRRCPRLPADRQMSRR